MRMKRKDPGIMLRQKKKQMYCYPGKSTTKYEYECSWGAMSLNRSMLVYSSAVYVTSYLGVGKGVFRHQDHARYNRHDQHAQSGAIPDDHQE